MARGNRPTSDTETRDQAAEAGATEPQVATEKKDLAVGAYVLFCKGQAEGDFPAWDELDPPTQKLWRDSYAHVAGGGKPRTDYESVVKYLILSAQ